MVVGQDCYNWASIISSGPKNYVLMMCRLWGSWAQSWPGLNWKCKTKVNQVSFSPITKKKKKKVGGNRNRSQEGCCGLLPSILRDHILWVKSPQKCRNYAYTYAYIHIHTRMYVHVTIDIKHYSWLGTFEPTTISSWDKMLIQIQSCFVKGLVSHSKLDQHIDIHILAEETFLIRTSPAKLSHFPCDVWGLRDILSTNTSKGLH